MGIAPESISTRGIVGKERLRPAHAPIGQCTSTTAFRMRFLGAVALHSRVVSAALTFPSYVISETLPILPSFTAIMSDSTTQPPDSNMEVNDELDPTVEEEINRDATEADAMNIDGAADAEPTVNGITDTTQTFEARIPAKKDATLREFLGKMDEYAPIVCQHTPMRQ
jgi:hypothetical protein